MPYFDGIIVSVIPDPAVRLVAATGVDIVAMVRRGEFLAGLYARIGENLFRLPALRERLAGLPEADQRKVLGQNVLDFYGLTR